MGTRSWHSGGDLFLAFATTAVAFEDAGIAISAILNVIPGLVASLGTNVRRPGRLSQRLDRPLADRLSFAARSDFRAASSFCKGHT